MLCIEIETQRKGKTGEKEPSTQTKYTDSRFKYAQNERVSALLMKKEATNNSHKTDGGREAEEKKNVIFRILYIYCEAAIYFHFQI